MVNHLKGFDDQHKCVMLKYFLQMKSQLAEKEERLEKVYLKKNFDEFDRLFESMKFDKLYSNRQDCYIKIKFEKDWIKPKCTIRLLAGAEFNIDVYSFHKIVYQCDDVKISTSLSKLYVYIRNPQMDTCKIYLLNAANNYKEEFMGDELLQHLYNGSIILFHLNWRKITKKLQVSITQGLE